MKKGIVAFLIAERVANMAVMAGLTIVYLVRSKAALNRQGLTFCAHVWE